MKKTLFNIDSQEKQRILEMHQNATNRLYLNEQEVTKQTPTPKPVDNNKLRNDYLSVMRQIWFIIRNNIVIAGEDIGGQTGIYEWQYPIGTTEPPTKLHKFDGSLVDQSSIDQYDKLFNEKLNNASEDNNWLNKVAKIANNKLSSDDNLQKNINFQTFIMNNIQDKSLVINNGTKGQPFNDGVFYSVTLKAAIKFKLQNGYRDSEWIKKKYTRWFIKN